MKRLLIGAITGLAIGLAIGLGVSANSQPKTAQTAQKTATAPTISQLLSLVNVERAKHGVAPLKDDPRLDASAQMKADDEVAYNYYGHISPKGSPYAGMHGYKLIDATGAKCIYESENLAWNTDKSQITAQEAVNWWISSPAHHAAMINAKYSLTGFGIVKDAVVEHFCQQ